MQSGAVKLGQVFANDQQNVIPLFQRPYVWSEGPNWLPLWDDIRQAAEEVAFEHQGYGYGSDKRTYFLGAVVLQYRPKPPQQVFLWNVVDGQQRLTTLQVLIAAARQIAIEIKASSLASSLGSMIENNKDVIHSHFPNDRYKVWPLPQDRPAYLWAVSAMAEQGSPPDAEHRLVHARQWFERTIREWALATDDPETRLYNLFETLKNRMELVQITLEPHDDPQVIFEVLNHRGVPLDAVDLVKNLLFQQLEHAGQATLAEKLLAEVWLPLDRRPWRDEITAGRIKRKLADVLLSYWLTVESQKEVPVEHLFSDFRSWLLQGQRESADVIRSIRACADTMEAIRALPLSDPTGQLVDRMEASQTSTPWPLLLYLHRGDAVPEAQRHRAAKAVDSFLMRRSICRMPSGDYNRLFLSILGEVEAADPKLAGDVVVQSLLSQEAASRRWPTDAEFKAALMATNLFHVVLRVRLKSLLLGIEYHLHTEKVDPVTMLSASDRRINIEHLLPQVWDKHWPLPVREGELNYVEILQRRNQAVHQLGNLTLMTTRLNPSISNKAWPVKKKEITKHALLRLTTSSVLSAPDSITDVSDDEWAARWDEDRIERRGAWLRDLAITIWRRPEE